MQTKERLAIPTSTPKDQFFSIVEDWLTKPDSDSIKEHGGTTYKYVYLLDAESDEFLQGEAWEQDNTIAFLMFNLDEERDHLINVEIYINESAFYRNGEDYSNLIPVVIRHETAELYHLLNSQEVEVADGYPHKQAVIEEFLFAHSMGKAPEYIALVMLWSNDLLSRRQEFIDENLAAFTQVMGGK